MLNDQFFKVPAGVVLTSLLSLHAFAAQEDVHRLTGEWRGETPLCRACMDDNHDEMRRLLAAGADPEKVAISRHGVESALMIADSVVEARILVESGANVNFVGAEGKTPLMGYLLHRPDAVKYLLSHGANPNARDHKGNTPLHHCTYNAESARLLIEAGADVNALNEAGNTPLMVQNGVGMADDEIGYGKPIVQLLLSCGADLNIRNKAGLTALDLAMTLGDSWYGCNPVLPLLQREGQTASLHAQLAGAAAAGKVELCKSLLQRGNPECSWPGGTQCAGRLSGELL